MAPMTMCPGLFQANAVEAASRTAKIPRKAGMGGERTAREALAGAAAWAGLPFPVGGAMRRRRLQLDQVVSNLNPSIEHCDRIASTAGFFIDPDRFKRMALRDTERWLSENRDRVKYASCSQ